MPKKEYTVYIAQCADASLYTGITTDLARRIEQHNGKKRGGATYTKSRRPVTLLYMEILPSRSLALKREYELKQYSRKEKIALCTLHTHDTLQ